MLGLKLIHVSKMGPWWCFFSQMRLNVSIITITLFFMMCGNFFSYCHWGILRWFYCRTSSLIYKCGSALKLHCVGLILSYFVTHIFCNSLKLSSPEPSFRITFLCIQLNKTWSMVLLSPRKLLRYIPPHYSPRWHFIPDCCDNFQPY